MKKRTLFLIFMITTIFACGVSLNVLKVSADDETACEALSSAEVIIFKAGHGSSALIQTEGKNILIDGGKKEDFPYINRHLKSRGIEEFDLVIITHPHSDHIGGISSLLDEYKVKRFMMKKEEMCTTRVYLQLIEKLREKEIEVEEPDIDGVIEFGCAHLDILGLDKTQSLSSNNNSIVCKLVCGEQSFLFTGDIGEKAEKELVVKYHKSLKVNALVVPHHGSSYSSSPEFLEEVNPEIAIVSANKSPEAKIKNRYDAVGAVMHNTYKERTSSYRCSSDGIIMSRCFTPVTPVRRGCAVGLGCATPTLCTVSEEVEFKFPDLDLETEETLCNEEEKLDSDIQMSDQELFKELCSRDEELDDKKPDVSFIEREMVESSFDTQVSSPVQIEKQYEEGIEPGFGTSFFKAIRRREPSDLMYKSNCPVPTKVSPAF